MFKSLPQVLYIQGQVQCSISIEAMHCIFHFAYSMSKAMLYKFFGEKLLYCINVCLVVHDSLAKW